MIIPVSHFYLINIPLMVVVGIKLTCLQFYLQLTVIKGSDPDYRGILPQDPIINALLGGVMGTGWPAKNNISMATDIASRLFKRQP